MFALLALQRKNYLCILSMLSLSPYFKGPFSVHSKGFFSCSFNEVVFSVQAMEFYYDEVKRSYFPDGNYHQGVINGKSHWTARMSQFCV